MWRIAPLILALLGSCFAQTPDPKSGEEGRVINQAGMGNVPEFHVRFDGSATVIRLTEDSHETVQPVLISRDNVEAEAAKLP